MVFSLMMMIACDVVTEETSTTNAAEDPDTSTDDTDSNTHNDGGTGQEDSGGQRDEDSGDPDPVWECDYRTVDGVLMVQAESLPLVEEWEVRTEFEGYSGDGYIAWSGDTSYNNPGNGWMTISVGIEAAGRYRLQWHNRIGQGDDPTEHNDSWVRFPDAADSYGLQGPADDETRRYPQPACEDDAFMDAVREMASVSEASCVEGASRDGWFKVYSTNAQDWKWSTNTSDHDASHIMVEFPEAGVYTVEVSARSSNHVIDRIVLHQEDIEDEVVHDEGLAETPCE